MTATEFNFFKFGKKPLITIPDEFQEGTAAIRGLWNLKYRGKRYLCGLSKSFPLVVGLFDVESEPESAAVFTFPIDILEKDEPEIEEEYEPSGYGRDYNYCFAPQVKPEWFIKPEIKEYDILNNVKL